MAKKADDDVKKAQEYLKGHEAEMAKMREEQIAVNVWYHPFVEEQTPFEINADASTFGGRHTWNCGN